MQAPGTRALLKIDQCRMDITANRESVAISLYDFSVVLVLKHFEWDIQSRKKTSPCINGHAGGAVIHWFIYVRSRAQCTTLTMSQGPIPRIHVR